jgi:hypothetical protein
MKKCLPIPGHVSVHLECLPIPGQVSVHVKMSVNTWSGFSSCKTITNTSSGFVPNTTYFTNGQFGALANPDKKHTQGKETSSTPIHLVSFLSQKNMSPFVRGRLSFSWRQKIGSYPRSKFLLAVDQDSDRGSFPVLEQKLRLKGAL